MEHSSFDQKPFDLLKKRVIKGIYFPTTVIRHNSFNSVTLIYSIPSLILQAKRRTEQRNIYTVEVQTRTKVAREYLHYWTMFANQNKLGHFAVNRSLPKHLTSFKFTFPPANSFTYKLGRFGLESCWNTVFSLFWGEYYIETYSDSCKMALNCCTQSLSMSFETQITVHEL